MRVRLGAIVLSMGYLACLAPAGAQEPAAAPVQADAATRTEASRVGRELVRNPSSAGVRAYVDRVHSKYPHGNVNELVFLVMREALKEANEDKKYWIAKLEMYNEIGKALSEYLKELSDLARGGGSGSDEGKGQPEVDTEIQSLRKALGQLEAVITRTKVDPAQASDVEELRLSLARDRKAIHVAEQELRRALTLGTKAAPPGAKPVSPSAKTPRSKPRMAEPRPIPSAEPPPPKLNRIPR